jgi:Protein tyrosine and serine/threonine kinase
MAPEALASMLYSEKSDVWSFAIVCHEVWERALPYPELAPVQVVSLVVARELRVVPPQGVPGLTSVMTQCLEWEPSERPTFTEICEALAQVGTDASDILGEHVTGPSQVDGYQAVEMPGVSTSKISRGTYDSIVEDNDGGQYDSIADDEDSAHRGQYDSIVEDQGSGQYVVEGKGSGQYDSIVEGKGRGQYDSVVEEGASSDSSSDLQSDES